MAGRFCYAAMTGSSAAMNAEDNFACSTFGINVCQDAIMVSFFLVLAAVVNIKAVIPVLLLIRLRSLFSKTE